MSCRTWSYFSSIASAKESSKNNARSCPYCDAGLQTGPKSTIGKFHCRRDFSFMTRAQNDSTRARKIILYLAPGSFSSQLALISQGRYPCEFRCKVPIPRYFAAPGKPDQVIYTVAGKCVNSFVYRVLID
jgi:hypothetical protein